LTGHAPSERGGARTTEARAARALALAAPALALFLLWRSWGAWADVVVDFGRELYVPWRLTLGEVLYRDLAWFNGPLSPHVNALWFRLFGVGAWTLFAVNLVLLGVLVALLRRVSTALGSPLAAGVLVLFFLPVFAFGHLVRIGNYNHLAPYSHEATHGLLLAVGAFALLVGPSGGRAWRVAFAGVLVGLVFLTKVELFLAALLGTAATVALREGAPARTRWGAYLGGLVVPPLVALAALATRLAPGEALRGALGSCRTVLDRRLPELPFYRKDMGLDAPLENALGVLLAAGITLVVFAPGPLLGRRLAPERARTGAIALALAALLAAALAPTDWKWLARGLPVATLALGLLALRARGRAGDAAGRARWSSAAGFALFALALLGKMLLAPHFGHYGFVLAVPATCLLVVALVAWLPDLVGSGDRSDENGGARACVLAGVLPVLAVAAVDLWSRSETHLAPKEVELGTGRDHLRADARGEKVRAVLARLDQLVDADAEVLVLPEGVSLNYLARRRSPTPYLLFMPPELIIFGEDAIVVALEEDPPDAIVLLHRDTSEYGSPFFGRDYGLAISAWVLEHYRHAWTDPTGGPPLQPATVYGASILLPREP
jgi:hypothetical protein